MELDLAYFNYEHGGLRDGGYDFAGLVRVAGEGDRWPHILVMGEGERYEHHQGAGMWGAADAMRTAGGRPYVPLPCSLPREWGPYAPVIFYDPQVVHPRRFGDHRAPDFAARHRNVLQARVGGELVHIATTHGDLHSPQHRLEDARNFRPLADTNLLSAILADWNESLSGPGWEPGDLADPYVYDTPWRYVHRLRGVHGRPDLPYRFATYALDYLCGWWDEAAGGRVGGIGFADVCELGGITTGTNLPLPSGRQCVQLDHILTNAPLAERIVPGSTRVHEPIDPERPDSDHKRVSVAVEV